MKIKIKKGDKVMVNSGKDRGKIGPVEKVFPKAQEVLVTGVNLFKRHLKPRGQGKPGGIVDIPRPLSVGKVSLVCPKCNQPTRIGFFQGGNDGESKLRVCRKCKAQF
jgi:large subunit ribosomal protein L24